ncbi:MAG: hypothetical protein HKN32_04440 [Flavobacteriales bacterium]|nr:hypothetical protein [Flavobacteriales bacterium]
MNWGTGLTIAMSAFIIYIVSMVVTVNRQNFELVSDTYYEDEMKFNDRYAALKLGAPYAAHFRQTSSGTSLSFALPEEIKGEVESASVLFRHPSHASKDKLFEWSSGPEIACDASMLDAGTIYTVDIAFEIDETRHLIQKSVRVP